jgi:hypothetical protein
MHWTQGVTWEAYVLKIIRFAKKYQFFQRMSEYGHQGAAPTNMDADQVVMRRLINELQRCVLEDGGASVASDLYTLYALERALESLTDSLSRRFPTSAVRPSRCNLPRQGIAFVPPWSRHSHVLL